MNIEIANRLLQLRKEKGLSQEQLAQELGISRQAVSKWERAEASPDTDNLIQLAKLYQISLDELLLTGNKEMKEENHEDETENHKSQDYVHIGKDGIHVIDKNGDEVHVSMKGVHVNERQGDHVDIDSHGIHVNNQEYTYEDFKHYHFDHNKKYDFPFGTLLFFGLLIYCIVSGIWHPTWVLLLAFPLFDSLVTAIRKKKFSKFDYPILATMIFLWLGFTSSLWHPAWVIFLTIPCYYSLAHYIDKKTS